ncbi:MAG: hypothetical protein ACKO23_16470 [Gemmataceae bacterium]
MDATAMREATRATPFQPFRLHLADGGIFTIPHPDFIAIGPNGRRIVIVHPDESMSILEPLLIVSMELPSPGQETAPDQSPNGKEPDAS